MMTIDHLRIDYRVTVLQEFTDAAGITMHASESGVIRDMSWDQLRDEIFVEIEPDTKTGNTARVRLKFSLKAQAGPRNGHMREFFEIGEYAPLRGSEPAQRDPIERKMIVPPRTIDKAGDPTWWREARNTAGPDRQEDVENSMRAEIQHIGVAASIAEMYAQRMRAFQQEGNEPRAVAAFKLADDWMSTYAGWATSGGEGAALSRERDEFHDALVKEFGYDPTADET